ncbi:MAG TPA: divergent polysaccharide deacetylase family protein [Stellaceae bacterium]
MPQTAPPVPAPAAEQPAWLRFAAAVSTDMRDRPRVAIVIDDLGLDRPRTERVMGLPAAVTLSFLPYSDDLPQLIAAARRNGHEMIVHVPMEPIDGKIDMGPNGLATNLSHDEVVRRLDWDLARLDGYVGINNHMGSRFTEDVQGMGWVMDVLKARGLMFLDSRTIGNSVGAKAAAAAGVPFAERDVFLDDDQHATAVEQRLKELEAIARKKGVAVAIGHPHDATIAALIGWIANLPQKNIVLVPLTEIVKAKLGIG